MSTLPSALNPAPSRPPSVHLVKQCQFQPRRPPFGPAEARSRRDGGRAESATSARRGEAGLASGHSVWQGPFARSGRSFESSLARSPIWRSVCRPLIAVEQAEMPPAIGKALFRPVLEAGEVDGERLCAPGDMTRDGRGRGRTMSRRRVHLWLFKTE